MTHCEPIRAHSFIIMKQSEYREEIDKLVIEKRVIREKLKVLSKVINDIIYDRE